MLRGQPVGCHRHSRGCRIRKVRRSCRRTLGGRPSRADWRRLVNAVAGARCRRHIAKRSTGAGFGRPNGRSGLSRLRSAEIGGPAWRWIGGSACRRRFTRLHGTRFGGLHGTGFGRRGLDAVQIVRDFRTLASHIGFQAAAEQPVSRFPLGPGRLRGFIGSTGPFCAGLGLTGTRNEKLRPGSDHVAEPAQRMVAVPILCVDQTLDNVEVVFERGFRISDKIRDLVFGIGLLRQVEKLLRMGGEIA